MLPFASAIIWKFKTFNQIFNSHSNLKAIIKSIIATKLHKISKTSLLFVSYTFNENCRPRSVLKSVLLLKSGQKPHGGERARGMEDARVVLFEMNTTL